jgi:hypothetical protein
VLREQDYRPIAARTVRPAAPIHYLPTTLRITPMACGARRDDLPPAETTTYRLADVTCTDCLDAVTASP